MHANASPSPQSHTALVGLIRGTFAFIAAASVALAGWIAVWMVVHGFRDRAGVLEWIGLLIILLVISLMLGAVSKRSYATYRRFDSQAVANFASVFALIIAVDWYCLLPAHLTGALGAYFKSNALLSHLTDTGDPEGITYRGVLFCIALGGFNWLINSELQAILTPRITGCFPSEPPQRHLSSGRDEPFVPFDPYDLSKNRPLRPL